MWWKEKDENVQFFFCISYINNRLFESQLNSFTHSLSQEFHSEGVCVCDITSSGSSYHLTKHSQSAQEKKKKFLLGRKVNKSEQVYTYLWDDEDVHSQPCYPPSLQPLENYLLKRERFSCFWRRTK